MKLQEMAQLPECHLYNELNHHKYSLICENHLPLSQLLDPWILVQQSDPRQEHRRVFVRLLKSQRSQKQLPLRQQLSLYEKTSAVPLVILSQ